MAHVPDAAGGGPGPGPAAAGAPQRRRDLHLQHERQQHRLCRVHRQQGGPARPGHGSGQAPISSQASSRNPTTSLGTGQHSPSMVDGLQPRAASRLEVLQRFQKRTCWPACAVSRSDSRCPGTAAAPPRAAPAAASPPAAEVGLSHMLDIPSYEYWLSVCGFVRSLTNKRSVWAHCARVTLRDQAPVSSQMMERWYDETGRHPGVHRSWCRIEGR